MRKAIWALLTITAGAFLLLAVTVVVTAAAIFVYEHTTKPLPTVEEKVQVKSPLVNICREVESGALDARTENGC